MSKKPTKESELIAHVFKDTNINELVNATCSFITEVLFIALPFVVLMIIYTHKGTQDQIWQAPELSFAAAVVYGQSIIKMIAPISSRGGFYGDRVALLCAFIVVLGLVPSLVILSLMLLSESPAGFLVQAQKILAGFSLLALWMSSLIARTDSIKTKSKKPNNAPEPTSTAVTADADASAAPSAPAAQL